MTLRLRTTWVGLVLAAFLAFILDAPALATDSTWQLNASGNWSDATAWSNGVPDGIGDTARLVGGLTSPRTVTIDGTARTLGALYLAPAANYCTLAGQGLNMDVAGGSILVESSSTSIYNKIDLPVTLYDPTTFSVTRGQLNMSCNVFCGSPGAAITKTGTGYLALEGTIPYAGDLVIADGTLHVNKLPTGNINLAGGVFSLSSIWLDWNLGTGSGQIQWTGSGGLSCYYPVSLNGGATLTWGVGGFVPDGCDLILGSWDTELQNPIDLAGGVRTVLTDTGGELSRTLSNGGLMKTGSGTLTLSGTNTYTGITKIAKGILSAVEGKGLPAASNLILAGGMLGMKGGSFTRSLGSGPGQVQWTDAGGFAASLARATINLGGAAPAVPVVWGTGGFVPDGAALILGGIDGGEADFVNPIDLNGSTRTFEVFAGLGTLSGMLSNGGFTKTGTGLLKLNGASTYAGSTTVAAGGLQVENPQALGAVTGLVEVCNGAYLKLGAAVAVTGKTLILSGNGDGVGAPGALRSASNTAIWAGPITLAGDAVISGPVTISGPITGEGKSLFLREYGQSMLSGSISGGLDVIVLGQGTWTLSGENTYTGSTRIEGGGRLRLGSSGAVPGGPFTIGGGILDLNGFNYTAHLVPGLENVGTVSLGSGTLTLDLDAGSTPFRCSINGTGGVTKTGAGTVVVSPMNPCTYSGPTVIRGGILSLTVLPDNSNVVLDGGILGFAGLLNGSLGTGPGQIHWEGNGGFAPSLETTNTTVVLGSSSDVLTWGVGGFVPDGCELQFDDSAIRSITYFRNPIDLNGQARTIRANGRVDDDWPYGAYLTGPLSGSGGLVKAGPGVLVLEAANTYTGETLVSEGTLVIEDNSGLGSTSAGTIVADGATLKLDAPQSAEPLTLNGRGCTGKGALIGSWGWIAPVWSGPILLASDAIIGADVSSFEVSGVISGNGALVVGGGATIVLTGQNDYTGPTILEGGQLRATDGVGLPAGSNLVLAGGFFEPGVAATFARTLGTGPGQVRWQDSGGFSAKSGKLTVQINGSSPLRRGSNGFVPDGAMLMLNSALATSEVELTNDIDLGSGILSVAVSDNVPLSTDYATLSGVLSNGGIRKTGNGTLYLKGDNTYDGPTEINDGVLVASHNSAFGTAEGGTIITGAGRLSIEGSVDNEPLTLQGSSGYDDIAVVLNAPTARWGGPVVLETDSKISLGSSKGELEIAGTVSGSGGLEVLGTGTLILSGSNNYTGATRIFTRTGAPVAVRAADGAGLPTSSNLILQVGLLEADGPTTFTRGLGTGAGQMQWGGGGFSSRGGKLLVAPGGTGSPTPLKWGQGCFGTYADSIQLNHDRADSETELVNDIDLGNGLRTVIVGDNPATSNDFATLSGSLSNGGLIKTGNGLLLLSGNNVFTGGLEVGNGILRTTRSGAIPNGNKVTIGYSGTRGTLDIGPYNLEAGLVTVTNGVITGTTGILTTTASALKLGSGSLNVSFGGSAGITVTGTAALTRANSYTGVTRISSGTLSLAHNQALGSGAAGTIVEAAGALVLNNSSLANEPLTLTASANVPTKSHLQSTGASTWTPTVSLTGTGKVHVGVLSGVLRLAGGLNATPPGIGLTKQGNGTLIISGNCSLSGDVTVLGGSLRLPQAAPSAACLVLDGGTVDSDGGLLTRSLGTAAGRIRWSGNGGFSARGGKLTVAIGGTAAPTALTWGSSYFVPVGKQLIFGSPEADSETVLTNTINLGFTTRTVYVHDNPASQGDRAVLSGSLSNGNLIKEGPGWLVLSGNNSSLGGLTLKAGTLGFEGAGLATSGNITLAGGVLQGEGTTTVTRSLGAFGGQIQWTAGGGFAARGGTMTVAIGGTAAPTTLTWGNPSFVPNGQLLVFGSPTADSGVLFRNPIQLGSSVRTIRVDDNPDSTGDFTTLGGALSGNSGGLTKTGNGTLTLSGANLYGRGTTVAEGTLLVTNASGSGTGTGAVSVRAATLGGTGFIGGPVTLTGDATLTSTGTLTIDNALTIQGLGNQLAAGTVLTSGDVIVEPGAVFIVNGTLGGEGGELIIHGTLMGRGTINKNCRLEGNGMLSPGEPSTIQTLSAIQVTGAPLAFSFEIGAAEPNYAAPSNSLNDLVRLTSVAAPFADASGSGPAALSSDTLIDVYFLWADPAMGRYKAEFFAETDFTGAIADATFQYWRLDPHGTRLYNGNFYSPLDASLVDWSVVPETALFGSVPVSGYITQLTIVPEPMTLGLLAIGGAVLLASRKRQE